LHKDDQKIMRGYCNCRNPVELYSTSLSRVEFSCVHATSATSAFFTLTRSSLQDQPTGGGALVSDRLSFQENSLELSRLFR